MEYSVFLLIVCLGVSAAALFGKPPKARAGSLTPGLDEVLYSSTPVPLLMVWLEDYTIISANKACGNLYGQNRMTGRPLADLFAEGKAVVEHVKKQAAIYEQEQKQGQWLSEAAASLQPGPKDAQNEANAYSALAPKGPLPLTKVELIYMSRDDSKIAVLQLTMSRVADDAAESALLLRAAFDACQHPIFLKDNKRRFVVFNEYYHRTFGSVSDNLIGKTGMELAPHDQAERISREDQEVLGRGVLRTAELWVTCADGRKALFSTTKSPVYNAAGEIIGLMGEGFDITGRRLEQETMTREKSLLRAVIDAIPDLVFYKDANCRYLGCNKSMENLLAVREEDIIGKTDADFLTPDLAASGARADLEAMKTGKRVVGEELMHTPGGALIYESVKTPYFTPDGKAIGIVCISRDITTRKESEKATKSAQIAADESNRAKSEFLANMSHEIRTPMNAIIGLAHLALKTDLSPKQHDYLSKIHNAGKALLGIVNDVLDFSKIEANQIRMESISFNLDDIFENLSSMLGQKSAEKGLEFIFAIDPDVPRSLIGDPLRLGQVLNNLVSNAIKFTQAGEIKVSCRTLKKDAGAIKLEFSVSDTGIGMTPEQQTVIFKAFGQADASTTRQYGGTGLGLVITKRLLQMMDGSIEVQSEYKKGTVINCTTTFKVPPDALDQLNFASAGLPENALVLVVDDNKTTCDSLESLLSNAALRPKSVHNSTAAFAELLNAQHKAPDQQYRAVIIDIGLEGAGGMNLITKIREHTAITTQPAIIISLGAGLEDMQSKARQNGANGFLPKPFTRPQLFNALCLAFRGRNWSVQRQQKFETSQKKVNTKPVFSGQNILLVEDNPINQQVAMELIEELDLNVTLCNNGQEALNLLVDGSNVFALVFMDLQMPVMDGYEATRIIRAQERFNNIPIIAMTAHAMSKEREHCLAIGMNDHIAKPIEVEKLYATLRQWIPEHKEVPVRALETASTRRSGTGSDENFTDGSAEARQKGHAPAQTPVFNSAYSNGRLDNLGGFDVGGALARLGGKEDLFRRLLCQFQSSHSQAGRELRQALDDGRREEAERIAHTIKGLAGNIGANPLAQAADILEKECLKYKSAAMNALPSSSLENSLVDFATELDLCLQRIKSSSICEADEAERNGDAANLPGLPGLPGKNAEQLKPLLEKLTALIDDNDAEAAFLLESLQKDLMELAPQECRDVTNALKVFDFDEAQLAMGCLLEKISI